MGSISGKNGSTTFAPPNKRSSAPTRSNLTGKNGIWSPPREHTRRGNVRFHRRPPRMFMAYAMNARVLHQFATKANVLRLLINAVQQQPLQEREVNALASQERRRVVDEVSRWSRDAGFNRRVLYGYGNRCAVTRVQLRLVRCSTHPPRWSPRQRRPRSKRNRPRAHLSPRVRRRPHLPRRAVPHEDQPRTTPIPSRPEPPGGT